MDARPTCLTKFILRVSTQGMVRVVRLCRNEPDNNETQVYTWQRVR